MSQATQAQMVALCMTQAFEVMQDPKQVCIGVSAQDAEGNRVVDCIRGEKAVCFCSLGVLSRQSYILAGGDFNLMRELENSCITYLSSAILGDRRIVDDDYSRDWAVIADFHDTNAFDNRSEFLKVWQRAVTFAQRTIAPEG